MSRGILDIKICHHLTGGHVKCCVGCHEMSDGMSFIFENSPVCCAAWIYLSERRENAEKAVH